MEHWPNKAKIRHWYQVETFVDTNVYEEVILRDLLRAKYNIELNTAGRSATIEHLMLQGETSKQKHVIITVGVFVLLFFQ